MAPETAKMASNIPRKLPFYKLFSFADKFDIVLMIIGTISAIANGLAWPSLTIVFGEVVDAFSTSPKSELVHQLSKVCLKYLYIAIGTGVAAFLQVSAWMITGERQGTRIRGLYLRTLLRQDIEFFDLVTTSGEVIGRMSGETLIIQDAVGEKVGKFIQLCATFFCGFAIALARGWLLSLVIMSCLPPLIIVGSLMTVFISKTSQNGQIAYANAGNVVEQTVRAIKTVTSFTGEKLAIVEYNRLLESAYTSVIKQAIASGLGFGAVTFILYTTYGLAVWYGARLIIEKGYTGGQVINVIIAITSGGTALGQASPCVNVFAAGQAAAYKMYEAINRKPLIDTYDTTGIVPDDIHGDIELKEVYFAYPARSEVQIFSGLSLNVARGSTTALVGQSGSGKSTIIGLIERFYDPQAGTILIDGVDLKMLQLKWIRQKIGLVSQEPVLFLTTIRENIAYGKENATDDEIRNAIELANAASFIGQLPKGLHTWVGDHGTQLSGGQKQRIAIARAILKYPKILLLDEATSALDAESERLVQDALVRVMLNRTTVVIAHRLSTIRDANVIAVVQEGIIVEQGTHEKLIENSDGAYSRLIRLQDGPQQASQHLNSSMQSIGIFSDRQSLQAGPVSSEETVIPGVENVEKVENKVKVRNEASFRKLVGMSRPEWLVLLLGSIAAAIHGAIGPTFGLLLSNSIEIFQTNSPAKLRKDSLFWFVVYVCLGGSGLLFIPGQYYLFGVAGGKLIQRVRSMCFEKVVHQDINWFDDAANSSGAIGARLSADAASLRGLVGDYLGLLVQNLSTIIVAGAIAFASNWILAFIILALLPFLGLGAYSQQKLLQGFSNDAKVMYEEATQVAADAVGNIRTVASLSVEQKVIDLYKDKCERPRRHGIRQGVISGFSFGFASFILYATFAAIFYIGAHLVKGGKSTFDEVFKVFFALTISAITISQTYATAQESNRAKESAASIFKILDRKPDIDSSSDQGTTLANVRGDISFNHISFRYPTRPEVQVLRNFCLSVPSGKVVALVGRSGSGKSTVISLLQRFYDPTSGDILLDGVEIQKLKLSWLRQQLGLVSQEPVLFSDTIRANIGYGRLGNATEEEIIAAAEEANAHNFISGLPNGYNTSVGERGVQLSVGQKQQIAIARAILKDPKILLLDEATSALDAESECLVQDALDGIVETKTTLVISHRLSAMKRADKIVVVQNGLIVEEGSHEALMGIANGAYVSLVSPYD